MKSRPFKGFTISSKSLLLRSEEKLKTQWWGGMDGSIKYKSYVLTQTPQPYLASSPVSTLPATSWLATTTRIQLAATTPNIFYRLQ